MSVVEKVKDPSVSGRKPKAIMAQTANNQNSTIAYLQDIKKEWGKISWPTWPQIWGQTIVVLVMTTIMTAGLWIIDNGFHLIISLIVPH